MALVAIAEDAQEVASEFLEFQDFLPEDRAADISALATELFSLKTALLDLNSAQKEPRNHRRTDDIEEERYVVYQSLSYTFKDIHGIIGTLTNPVYRSRSEAHRGVWRKLEDYFYNESHNELITRLQYYKSFVNELTAIVVGEQPYPEFDDLYLRIDHLLDIQEDSRLADELENLEVGAPRVRSFERTRPYGLDRNGQPNGRGRPREHQGRRRRQPSPVSPGLPMQYFRDPPSPPSTATESSFAESSSADSSMPKHWIVDVFSQDRTTTMFETSGSESACFAEHQKGASKKLREQHEKIMTLPFEHLEVRFYYRERDRRARLWCRMDRRSRYVECTQPIPSLRIFRQDSCLQLYRKNSSGKLQLWANLRFHCYERLVLFHCCFLALKVQDEGDPVRKLDDHILDGEMPVFSGKIRDDNYDHALQLFKDEDSGGVRLQASVLRGDLKRSPVWVAFINYNMMARKWIKLAEPKKVHLMDLNRYIFCDDYKPQMAPTGAHELHFHTREGASDFVQAIEDVAEGRV